MTTTTTTTTRWLQAAAGGLWVRMSLLLFWTTTWTGIPLQRRTSFAYAWVSYPGRQPLRRQQPLRVGRIMTNPPRWTYSITSIRIPGSYSASLHLSCPLKAMGWGVQSVSSRLRLHSSTADTNTATSSVSGSTRSSNNTAMDGTWVQNGTRLSRQDLSLNLQTITNHLDVVQSHCKARRASIETIDAAQRIFDMADQRVHLIQQRDAYLNQRKELSALIGKLMMTIAQKEKEGESILPKQMEELEQAKATSNAAADGASHADAELENIQSTMDDLLAGLPNLLDDRVPDGKDDSENEVVFTWGDIAALPKQLGWTDDEENQESAPFVPQWHDDVAVRLGGYQSEAAVKISGARFVALSGPVARLERALAMFLMDLHTTQHGYTEVSVPYVVSRSALEGTSQLPKFELDLFAIRPESHTCNGEDAFLIPTAEVPVTNLHREQVLEQDDLPISYVAWTPCFRAEAGSYGRDTKGLIRTHQFHKVELVKITDAVTSDEQHELLTKHAEACLQQLQLPYRKVRLCSGDTGFGARHCYDLEVWLPGAQEYREISSCSNTGDFQARRMALRYRPRSSIDSSDNKKGKKMKKPKPVLCHTINGSGLAVGRTLVAVLENYQTPDGRVVIPEVLRPYMGGQSEILPPG